MLLAGRKFVMEVLAIDNIEPRRFAFRISCNKIINDIKTKLFT